MKQKLKPFFPLAVILVAMFTAVNTTFYFAANATYVEGLIAQDTIWTLTDSPFILSKNVTVLSTATLTIEPGVEVRFGGNFSLIVEGRLRAIGNVENKVIFTSNRDQPERGDWNSIEFVSAAQPSELVYCVLKYAKNATTIENSIVEIRNSEISFGSQNGLCAIKSSVEITASQITANKANGILADNSSINVQTTSISDNLESGIYLKGDNQATLRDNTIRANANGILLTGNSTLGIEIAKNTVLSNTDSGIEIGVTDYHNISIIENILSSNNRGFYISGQAATEITNNSISFNEIGFYYEQANHQVHWNDIYSNALAMDVSSNGTAIVNAEYNYWGHESGPYHQTLNPKGEGNPVHGDGYNIDFLFYLTAPISYINERPIAKVLADKTLVTPVAPDNLVTLIATNSSDDKRVNQYLYDFGDGTPNSGWTTLSIFTHRYTTAGNYTVTVTVRDDFDVPSINTAAVSMAVQALTPLSVSLTLGTSTVVSEGQIQTTVSAAVGASPMANANIMLASVAHGVLAISFGTTNATGQFTTTLSAPRVDEQTHLRIIATATKNGYADGSDFKYVRVVPPLVAQVILSPNLMKSEATANGTVHVTYADAPVSQVTIGLSSDKGGIFSPEQGTTDLNGDFRFVFAAPRTMTDMNITVTATAAKSGYWSGADQATLTVQARLLTVVVTANPETLQSQDTTGILVHVTSDGSPVANATISVLSDSGGNFSATNGLTDSDGYFQVSFSTPEVTQEAFVTITATANKTGYVAKNNQTQITVTPAPSPQPPGAFGLPLTTLLLIVVPIVAVAVVAILIKMKIIVISRGEEEESFT